MPKLLLSDYQIWWTSYATAELIQYGGFDHRRRLIQISTWAEYRRTRRQRGRGGREWGGAIPPQPTRRSGGASKLRNELPQQSLGRSPGRKRILVNFWL